jgi:hypothetical protein
MTQDNLIPQDLEISNPKNLVVQTVGSVFHQHWTPRGHTFGACMTRPEISWMYVNIPKCASSWTKPKLIIEGLTHQNYYKDNLYHKHALIVLRDPVERWLSGVCEYFALYHPNMDLNDARRPFYELVLDLVTLDDHTERQVYFISDLNPAKSTYLWCDSDYRVNFAQWLRTQSIDNRYQFHDYIHTTEESAVRKKFHRYFCEFLKNEKYVDHIKAHYKSDYDLINSVEFWRG